MILYLAALIGCAAAVASCGNPDRPPVATTAGPGSGSGSGSASPVVNTPAPSFMPLVLAEKAKFVLGAEGPRHADDAEMVVFSADGRRLASIDQHGTAFIWDVATGAPLDRKATGSHTYRPSIGFGPDGALVIYDPAVLGTLQRSADNRWLLTVEDDKPSLVEIATGKRQPFDIPDPFGFSVGGGTVVVIDPDRNVTAGPLGSPRQSIAAAKDRTYVAVVSPDGMQVASAGQDATSIQVRSVSGGAPRLVEIEALAGSNDGVTAFAWSADSKRLAVAVGARALAVVELRGGTANVIAQDAFANDIDALAFSPDGRWIAGGTEYGRVRLWDATTGALAHRHTGHIGTAWGVGMSDDGKTVASAGDERALVWTPESSSVAAEYGDHEHWVIAVAVAADGTRVASCSDYGDINVRALPAGTIVAKLHAKGLGCEGLALRGSTVVVSTGTEANVFSIRDGAKPSIFRLAAGRKYGSSALAVSTDGRVIASGGDDGRIAIHTLSGGAKRWLVELPADRDEPKERVEVHKLAFDRAGKQLAAVTGDDLLRIYDVRTGKLIRSHAIRHGCTTGLTFAGTDRFALGCTTGDILVYDGKGAIAFEAKHREGGVFSLAATDERLVAGGADGSLTVWELP